MLARAARAIQLLERHPIANLFPMMGDAALQELTDDIREHGLREPITLYQGKVLDGRNREWACGWAEVEPRYVQFDGNDAQALDLVVSLNLHRRHLDASQRAMIAADIATMRQGERTDLSPPVAIPQAAAAKALSVSKRSVERATTVRKHGTPELIAAVTAGDIPVSTAAELAREPVEHQRAVLNGVPHGEKIADYDAKKIVKANGTSYKDAFKYITTITGLRRAVTDAVSELDRRKGRMTPEQCDEVIGAVKKMRSDVGRILAIARRVDNPPTHASATDTSISVNLRPAATSAATV